jgi:hypothetical protein
LECAYYEGAWQTLPKFDTLKPVKEIVATTITLPDFARKEDFGLTFKGLISIPSDGLYEFALSSDDGSRLWVADTLVVDNDGVHGSGDMIGFIALKAGFHQIRVDMFQSKGDEDLSVMVNGPGVAKQKVAGWLIAHETVKAVKGARAAKVTKKVPPTKTHK